MMTLNLAVRNLLRNRRRSLGTLVAMSIGCAAILLFGGFSGNINYEMLTRIVQRGGQLVVGVAQERRPRVVGRHVHLDQRELVAQAAQPAEQTAQ